MAIHPFYGAILAWGIAFLLTHFFALIAKALVRAPAESREGVPSTTGRQKKPRISGTLISAAILIYYSISIVHPFPFLNLALSAVFTPPDGLLSDLVRNTKIQDILFFGAFVLSMAVIGARPRNLVTAFNGTGEVLRSFKGLFKKVPERGNIRKLYGELRFMLVGPAILQIHIIAAATDSILSSVGGILVVGAFVISGVVSWNVAGGIIQEYAGLRDQDQQFPASNEATELAVVNKALVQSLLATALSALFGSTILRLGWFDTTPLGYAAAFSLLIVPYLLMFYPKNPIWKENKAFATVIAIIVIAFVGSIKSEVYPSAITELAVCIALWYIILRLPKSITKASVVRRLLAAAGDLL